MNNKILFYQNKNNKNIYSLIEKKGFLIVLKNEYNQEIIKTTIKKLKSDYNPIETTIHK